MLLKSSYDDAGIGYKRTGSCASYNFKRETRFIICSTQASQQLKKSSATPGKDK
jgi:hypothetical protein